jgi:anti-sigma factor RsiW
MSSREFDSMLDDLVRQAMYPFGEAEPPMRVWRRVLRTVRSMSAVSPAPASLLVSASPLVAFFRWLGFLSGMRKPKVTYVPSFSNRSYYVDSRGRYLLSSFWDVAMKQMFDLRLAL